MRKLCLWLLALLVIFACSPTTQLQDSIAEALTQTQAAQATIFPTFTPGPTRTPYPTRTPLGGGSLPVVTPGNFPTPTPPPSDITPEATDPGPYPPPSGPTATPTPSPTAGESQPSNTPTATTSGGGYPAPQTNTPAGPYPPPSVSTFTPTPTFTPSITPSPTPTVDLLFTPSTTPITPSPTITLTPNPNFTPTPSPTPTITRTPTRTLTPTRTTGPSPTPTITTTPTPALPDLTGLIIDTDDLNAISNIWEAPPEDITYQLQDLGGEVCEVVCVGLQWTSLDSFDTLVLTAYRTSDFGDAIQAAFSAQFLYLAQGFELENIPPGIILPDHSWAASKWNQDFVIYTSQGPAVLSFFWHADSPIGTQNTIALLAEYMETQAEILRLNGYITINPNATPLP